jgi:hypothetical protein
MIGWLQAFLFTQLVEVPIYTRTLGCSIPVALGASALTHPVVWFGFFGLPWDAPYTEKLLMAESFAWLVEALYFGRRSGLGAALWWSLIANGTSLAAGLLSRTLFGVP